MRSQLPKRALTREEFERKFPYIKELTASEKRVLEFVARKRTNKEIAKLLNISHRTVENHRTNIAQKIGLRGSHSLLKFATANKIHL